VVAAFNAVYNQGAILHYMETGRLEGAEHPLPINC